MGDIDGFSRNCSPEDEYVEAAVLHRQLLEAGNRKGSNAAHDRLIRAVQVIRNRDDRGRSFLLGNLTHDNDENVRLWSAAHLLKLEKKTALAELAYLAKHAKFWMVRSSADVTATEWQKGLARY